MVQVHRHIHGFFQIQKSREFAKGWVCSNVKTLVEQRPCWFTSPPPVVTDLMTSVAATESAQGGVTNPPRPGLLLAGTPPPPTQECHILLA